MRACAAISVVVTHVAFRLTHRRYRRPAVGRFDLAVAVFFALSALLWRGHAAAARGLHQHPDQALSAVSGWCASPGYLVAVVVVLALLPDADTNFTCGWPTSRSPRSTSADADRQAHPDLEPVGGGQFYLALPLLALLASAAGAGTDPGHRRGGPRGSGVGLLPLHRRPA